MDVLISIVAFLGVVAGMLIASRSKEELKTGRKYFLWVERITLLGIVAVLLADYTVPLLWRVATYLIVAVILLGRIPPATMYALLGIALAASRSLSLNATLLFVYGLAHGSLAYMTYKREDYPALLMTRSPFFITFIIVTWKPF